MASIMVPSFDGHTLFQRAKVTTDLGFKHFEIAPDLGFERVEIGSAFGPECVEIVLHADVEVHHVASDSDLSDRRVVAKGSRHTASLLVAKASGLKRLHHLQRVEQDCGHQRLPSAGGSNGAISMIFLIHGELLQAKASCIGRKTSLRKCARLPAAVGWIWPMTQWEGYIPGLFSEPRYSGPPS